MTFRDLIVVSTGNLWRMKLRTTLTTAGVVIAIGAFVSMLSFGAGNQENFERQFNTLGLFTTLTVSPKQQNAGSDSERAPLLDDAAIERLAGVHGVNLVYPYDAISAEVRLGDTVLTTRAQALPTSAIQTKLFSNLVAGAPFDSNNARQAIISEELMRHAGFRSADSLIGTPLVVSVKVSSIDSGLARIISDRGKSIVDRLRRIKIDSLMRRSYRTRVARAEAQEVIRRFAAGFFTSQRPVRDTLVICGVRQGERVGRLRIEPIIIPAATANRFRSEGMGGSPTEMYSAMSRGTLFSESGGLSDKTYPQVTVDFDPKVPYSVVRDSIEAMGFRVFSFAAQFEEVQRIFLYFDLALGVVGLIALVTASLGIVNTMVMSILERKREIGVLKSLGADDFHIRALFMVESGVIGLLGSAGGILLGWIVTRIISAVSRAYMEGEGLPSIDFFAMPLWLLLVSVGLGLGVSVLAGLYPAVRASRVDPVEALRND